MVVDFTMRPFVSQNVCGSEIQAAVLYRLGDMTGGDVVVPLQIGNAARHLEHTVISARRKIEAADGLLQQRDAVFVGRA
jgi:hypothetical protein